MIGEWSPQSDLTRSPLPYQGSALPAELCGPGADAGVRDEMVGREGFEPPCLSDLVYSQASRRCSTDPLWRRHRIELRPWWIRPPNGCALEPTTGLEPGTCGLQNR